MNSDKVVFLFHSFPNRTVCLSNQPTAYNRINDRLNAALWVYDDSEKAPLVSIGKSTKLQSVSGWIDPQRDIFNFFYSQNIACNIKSLKNSQVMELNLSSVQKIPSVMHSTDTCSAHFIEQINFSNAINHSLTANMTSALHSVNAVISRLFNVFFQSLLVNHFFTYVDNPSKKDSNDYKLHKEVHL